MQNPESPDSVTVTGLFSYPVKGCRAIAHTTASVLTTGLTHDREWMIVDARPSPAPFMTQRQCPAMAILRVESSLYGGLTLSTDDGDALLAGPPSRNTLIKVKVWEHQTVAFDLGDDAAKWLRSKLGLSHAVRLVQFNRDMRRDCSLLYAGESGAHTYFADGYPMLMTNAASLTDLNRRIDGGPASAVPMNRFRPNLVVDNLPAWDEDHVNTLTIGEVVLKLVKPCVRCEVTTTDQATGLRPSDQPLNTLARFRNSPEFGGVTFGWNAVVLTPGNISTGDQVNVGYRF
jgi:uncharacterized protein YcbX